MDLQLKPISKDGIPEAISKAELYRYLNAPGEAESICRDILAADAENQTALRLLGLSITDQFNGSPADRFSEAESNFKSLRNEYERLYYVGILNERQAKAQLAAGRPPYTVGRSLRKRWVTLRGLRQSDRREMTTQFCAGTVACEFCKAGWGPIGGS